MALNILIVDDEPLARVRLKTLLADCTQPTVQRIAEAANATEALQALAGGGVDVVLLDIHMPGADGLTLAQALRALPAPPAVVFVTAHAEHALRAFELEALDYLTKPVRLERLQSALQRAARRLQSRPSPEGAAESDALVIQTRHRTERVPLDEVLYLRAELKYLTVCTRQHSYILEATLADLEGRYPERFIRIHRNALVARHAVRALERQVDPQDGEAWAVRLDGIEERLWVSRRQLAAVRALLVDGLAQKNVPDGELRR